MLAEPVQDLFRGHQSRERADLEIATPLWDFDRIRERMSAYDFYVAHPWISVLG